MDWYEEVVLLVEGRPNKQLRLERKDGWLICHCKPWNKCPVSLPYTWKAKTKTQLSLGGKERLLALHYFMDVVCLTTGYWELTRALNSLSSWCRAVLTESEATGFAGWWWLLLSNASVYFEICLTFESSFIIRLNVYRYLGLMYLSNSITLACGYNWLSEDNFRVHPVFCLNSMNVWTKWVFRLFPLAEIHCLSGWLDHLQQQFHCMSSEFCPWYLPSV